MNLYVKSCKYEIELNFDCDGQTLLSNEIQQICDSIENGKDNGLIVQMVKEEMSNGSIEEVEYNCYWNIKEEE